MSSNTAAESKPVWSAADFAYMQRAIELAKLGDGSVQPNPMVGCVIVLDDRIIGEGYHRCFGGPHAEVDALANIGTLVSDEHSSQSGLNDSPSLRHAKCYVTLEPCCHHGKTPPCADALIRAGIGRVVIAMRDPFPAVDGGGIRRLQESGIAVSAGLLEAEAASLNAPYLKLIKEKMPWVIAKWAMTLDGKIASRSGHSQWISSPRSRQIVHDIRRRVDAILVGSGTALADNPLLTARYENGSTYNKSPLQSPKKLLRIVADSRARLRPDSKLAQTARECPVLIWTGPEATLESIADLRNSGCQVIQSNQPLPQDRLVDLLHHLGEQRITNLLVEGGSQLVGSLLDAKAIDECHIFIAPKIIGGETAPSPVGGKGIAGMDLAQGFTNVSWRQVESDIYFSGRVNKRID